MEKKIDVNVISAWKLKHMNLFCKYPYLNLTKPSKKYMNAIDDIVVLYKL